MARPLIRLLAVVTGLASLSCARVPAEPPKSALTQAGLAQLQGRTPAILQRDLMNFADRFASSTAAAYDELAAVTPNPEAKRIAIERKVNHVASAYANAPQPSPIAGLLDMLVMTRLLRETSQDPWFAEMFGDHSLKLVIKLRVQEEDLWAQAGRYLTEEQLKELSDAIKVWRETHPGERYVSMVRLSDFPEAKSPAER